MVSGTFSVTAVHFATPTKLFFGIVITFIALWDKIASVCDYVSSNSTLCVCFVVCRQAEELKAATQGI